MNSPYDVERDQWTQMVHIRSKRTGECIGHVEADVYEMLLLHHQIIFAGAEPGGYRIGG